MELGSNATLSYTVTESDTASAVGSGDLPVLGTPRLLAWAEAATCAAIAEALEADRTSVGTRIELEHLAASPVGATVTVTASVKYADGRLLRFDVVAEHEIAGTTKQVAHGEVTRVVVNRDRFLSRL